MVTLLLLSLVNNEKKIPGNFDDHADAPLQFGAHFPIEHNQGFTRSH